MPRKILAPDRRGRDAQEHEHDGEADHEQRRLPGDTEKMVAGSLRHVGEVESGDDREIAGNDRQHARQPSKDSDATAERSNMRTVLVIPALEKISLPNQASRSAEGPAVRRNLALSGEMTLTDQGTRRARCAGTRLVAVLPVETPGDPRKAGAVPGAYYGVLRRLAYSKEAFAYDPLVVHRVKRRLVRRRRDRFEGGPRLERRPR